MGIYNQTLENQRLWDNFERRRENNAAYREKKDHEFLNFFTETMQVDSGMIYSDLKNKTPT